MHVIGTLLLVLLRKKLPLCTYQNILTVKVLDSAPVLCPAPEEPTLSRCCLPQSEKDKKNVVNFSVDFMHCTLLVILPYLLNKGQLISMFKIFQKCNEKIVRISSQKSKKWSNQTNKDKFVMLISPYI